MESPSQTATPVVARLVVAATIGAAFMSSLDLFVVNVAFDDIGHSLKVGTAGGPTPSDLSWVLNAYAVVFAALLVPLGRLADRYGRKQLFVGGLALFVVTSAACAVSTEVWELVAFRALQAAGAAAMTPTSLGILMAALPPAKRVGGVRLWAATGALAAAFGPTVGGVLTQVSWHWIFLINVPVGVVLLWLAVRHVREERPDDDAVRPDLLGAVLFAVNIGLLALGLVKSDEWGWGGARTWAALAGSVVVLAAFAWRSSRHVEPVIHPDLLRVRTFTFANLAMITFNVAFAANLLVGILWLQQIWGYSVMRTGFAVAVGPVAVPITAALTHRFLPAMHPARLVMIGSLVVAAGIVVLATTMTLDPHYATSYLPGWVLGGVGVGFALPNLMAGGTRDLAPHQSATGSGIVTMGRQIGAVIGVSILFAIVGDRTGAAAADAFRATWWVSAAALVIAAALALGMQESRSRVPELAVEVS